MIGQELYGIKPLDIVVTLTDWGPVGTEAVIINPDINLASIVGSPLIIDSYFKNLSGANAKIDSFKLVKHEHRLFIFTTSGCGLLIEQNKLFENKKDHHQTSQFNFEFTINQITKLRLSYG